MQPPALKGHFSCVPRVAAHSSFKLNGSYFYVVLYILAIEHIISIIYHFLWPVFMFANYYWELKLPGADLTKYYEHKLTVVYSSL